MKLPAQLTSKDLVGFYPDHLQFKDMSFVDRAKMLASYSVDDKPVAMSAKQNYCSEDDAKAYIKTMQTKMRADGHNIKFDDKFDKNEINILAKHYLNG